MASGREQMFKFVANNLEHVHEIVNTMQTKLRNNEEPAFGEFTEAMDILNTQLGNVLNVTGSDPEPTAQILPFK